MQMIVYKFFLQYVACCLRFYEKIYSFTHMLFDMFSDSYFVEYVAFYNIRRFYISF